MKAMIFAAGKGTRLGNITRSIPKALVDINGKTALQIAVEKCTASGFDDIIINVHHFPEMVIQEASRLKEKGYIISVSDERDLLLETGGGLFKARNFFGKDPFLIYNVDIISDLDLSALYNHHQVKNGMATLATRHRKGNRFLLIDAEGRLRGWRNITTGEQILTDNNHEDLEQIAFSGIHILDPDIFNYMKEGIYSMTTLYLELAAQHKIYTYTDDSGFWGDIGTPENLDHIRKNSGM